MQVQVVKIKQAEQQELQAGRWQAPGMHSNGGGRHQAGGAEMW